MYIFKGLCGSAHRTGLIFIEKKELTMVVVLKHGVTEQQSEKLVKWFESQGLTVHVSHGEYQSILGLIGDTSAVDVDLVAGLDIVDGVKRITEPFKKANRKLHPDDSVINCGGALFGGGHFPIMAGPCSVENEEQIVYVARRVKAAGAAMLRGGAFKPRTSPYDFRLHEEHTLSKRRKRKPDCR